MPLLHVSNLMFLADFNLKILQKDGCFRYGTDAIALSNFASKYIKKDASVIEVLELFEKAMHQGVNLLALMITESGKRNEKPLGIITVADLPKIINLINN